MWIHKQLPLIKRILVMREHKNRLFRHNLYHWKCIILKKLLLLSHLCFIIISRFAKQLAFKCECSCCCVVWTIWTELENLAGVLKIDVNTTASSNNCLWSRSQLIHRVTHSLGWIIVVIVHINDDFALSVLMHEIAFATQLHLLFHTNILNTRDSLKQVTNRVGSIINHNPLHTFSRVFLSKKAFDKHRDKLATVISWSTYAYEWLTKRHFFLWCFRHFRI